MSDTPVPDPEPSDLPPVHEAQALPTALPGIPFPPFVLIFAAVTAIVFLFALTRLPRAISAGVDFEKADKKLEANLDAPGAVRLLKSVEASYPNSQDVQIKLALADVRSDALEEAVKILEQFDGKQVSEDQSKELDRVEAELKQKLPPDVGTGNDAKGGGN